MSGECIRIFVCGDVMTGRGIDQILGHPCDPRIYETYLKDARDYITIAEEVNGEIPRGVAGSYLWKNVINEWRKRRPLVKIINLETAVTDNSHPWPGKGINYRMHPENIDALTSAGFDICTLANNHILDWNVEGLRESLATLSAANIHHAGAGANDIQAMAPAIRELPGGKRLLVFSMGTPSSGILSEWAATPVRPGVWFIPELDNTAIGQIKKNIDQYRQEGDLVVVSIHWGSNWVYEIPVLHREFAHALVDEADVSLVHGHSSHHPLAIEIYRDSPLLYGCGDFINDYEGIGGMEEFRGDLSLMYFLEFDPRHLHFRKMELVPLQVRNFRLHHASTADREWLYNRLADVSSDFHTGFTLADDNTIHVISGMKEGEINHVI